jgi:hypothetical protein
VAGGIGAVWKSTGGAACGIARAMRGSSKSGSGGPSGASASFLAAASFSPLVMAKRLTCLDNFLWPHLGQTDWRSGFTRFERKL